jgi:hypothetical protein
MELTMQERGKLTMVKPQAYLKAGKTKKSEVLDDFCGGWDIAGNMRPVSCARQDSGISWKSASWSLIPRSVCAGTVLPGTTLRCRRH